MKFLLVLLMACLFIAPAMAGVDDDSCKTELIKSFEPYYPDSAKVHGIEGTVLLELTVIHDGTVDAIYIKESDNELFNTPAINAALKFQFTAFSKECKPIKLLVPFKFKLKKD